jgi:GTP cyclohydrolase I
MHSDTKVEYETLLRIGRELIEALGDDPTRPGLSDTPRRFADWWREFIEYEPGETATSFVSSSDLVCVTGIRVYSICEHHLLPFWCDVSIAYVPNGRVLGLSKFARIAQQFAHRLQIQEQLGQQIADEVMRIVESKDVAVHIKGEHLCMSMRGIRTPANMISTTMHGVFRENSASRAEFLQMVSSGS